MPNPIDAFVATLEPVEGGFVDPASGLFLRDRSDAFLLVEQRRAYAEFTHFPYGSDDVALDLGGAIGTFVSLALGRLGVGRVVSIEPLPAHQAVYRRNWGRDPRVVLVEGAVAESNAVDVPFYVGRNYSHCSSLTGARGRATVPVSTYAFEELLYAYQPTLIKCDIEGGEHALNWSIVPDTVTEIGMELHGSRSPWIDSGRRLDETLLGLGFSHVRAPKHKRPYNGAQMAFWSRRPEEMR